MEWYQFYWQWLQKAFGYPLWVLDVIAMLFVFARFVPERAFPRARARMKTIGKYAAYALVMLVLFGVAIAPYSMYLDEQQQHLDEYEQMVASVSELTHDVDILEQKYAIIQLAITASNIIVPYLFVNKSVVLGELATDQQISNIIFTNCNIFGEPSRVHFVGCYFINTRAKPSSTCVAVTELPPEAIELRNCMMEDCCLWNVEILGTSEELEEYRTNIVFEQ